MSGKFRNSILVLRIKLSNHPNPNPKIPLKLSQSHDSSSSSIGSNIVEDVGGRTTSRDTPPFSPSSFLIFPLFTIPPSFILCDYDFSFVLSQNQIRRSAKISCGQHNGPASVPSFQPHLHYNICHMRTLHPPAYLHGYQKNTLYMRRLVSPHYNPHGCRLTLALFDKIRNQSCTN